MNEVGIKCLETSRCIPLHAKRGASSISKAGIAIVFSSCETESNCAKLCKP